MINNPGDIKRITVDPKSWLDRTIPNDIGGQNAAEEKEQVMPFLCNGSDIKSLGVCMSKGKFIY